MTTLFLADQFDFPSSSKALKRLCFGQNFYAEGKFFEKTGQKSRFWALFEKI